MVYPQLREGLLKFREVFQKKLLAPGVVNLSKDFLKRMVDKPEWTRNEAFRIYNIIKPYKLKLKEVGFDFSIIPPITIGTTVQSYAQKVHGVNKTISIKGDKFVIRFGYHPKLVEKMRTIPGRLYNGEFKYWTVPLTESNQVKQFAMGEDFTISDNAERMLNSIEENFEASYNAAAVDLGFKLKLEFYPFQSSGVDYGIKNRQVIFADEMGLGKTPQSIGVVEGLQSYPAICIVPKSLRYNWVDEWAKFTDRKVMIADSKVMKRLDQFISYGYCEVLVVNYEGVQSYFTEKIIEVLQPVDGEIYEGATIRITGIGFPGYDRNNPKHKKFKVLDRRPHHVVIKDPISKRPQLVQLSDVERVKSYKKPVMNGKEKLFKSVILDEGHEVRNRSTMRFKTISKVFLEKEVRLVLTGTPIVNGPQDLSALLDIIGKIDHFGGSFKFNKEYGELTKVGLNSSNVKVPQKLKDLNVKLRSLCFIRREKFQVLKELPDKMRKIIRVDLDNRAEYDKAFSDLRKYLMSQNVNPKAISRALRAELLVKINLLKQISAKGKLSAFKEFVAEVTGEGEKLIIFTWFLETGRFVKKHFDNVVTITGDDTDEEVQENKRRFMEDPECKIIVVSYKRGGVGHTLTSSSKVAMIELGWTYKDQSQAEDRAHRIGQKNNVIVYYFLGKDTIDEDIYRIIDAKRQIEKETTGGQSEVETSTFTELAAALMKPDNQT